MQKHQDFDKDSTKDMDFADWGDESYEIASTSVYDGVDENKAVP